MLNRLTSSGNKSKGSIPAALFGLLLCLGSVILLWTNEGRPDLSKTAQNAIIVAADSSGADADGQQVSISGRVEVADAAYDREYGVGDDYLRLQREIEMYAWVEHEDEDHHSYSKEWTDDPADSDSFDYSVGHSNPPMSVQEQTFYAGLGTVGNFDFDPHKARLISSDSVALGTDLRVPTAATVSGGYIYVGQGTPSWPLIGDVRIHYTAVPAGRSVTLFGQLRGQHVQTFVDGKAKVYGIWEGGHDEALEAMHTEYVVKGWAARIGGFVMMWVGMLMVLSPLSNLLGHVPLLGQVGKWAIAGITFVLALVISLAIISVSFIIHRWYLILLLLAVAIGVAVFMSYRNRQRGTDN